MVGKQKNDAPPSDRWISSGARAPRFGGWPVPATNKQAGSNRPSRTIAIVRLGSRSARCGAQTRCVSQPRTRHVTPKETRVSPCVPWWASVACLLCVSGAHAATPRDDRCPFDTDAPPCLAFRCIALAPARTRFLIGSCPTGCRPTTRSPVPCFPSSVPRRPSSRRRR